MRNKIVKLKISLLFAFLLPIPNTVSGQDYFHIRDHKHNLVVSQSISSTSTFVLSEYGIILRQLNRTQPNSSYVFQGQEFDLDLGLCYFPSRLYSAKSKRFFQPDPQSQYFSPYSYVNGDPINYVDNDGEQGKALFLYCEEHSVADSKSLAVSDLIDGVPDAYHFPIADVMNKEVASLPEWNGNVFVISHSQAGSPYLELEGNSDYIGRLYDGPGAKITEEVNGKFTSEVNSKTLGRSLKELSLENDVEVKSIVLGSCESETAAQSLAEGFSAGSTEAIAPFKVTGLRKEFQSAVMGPKSLYSNYGSKLKQAKTEYMIVKKGAVRDNYLKSNEDGSLGYHKQYYKRANEREVPVRSSEFIPSVEGDELDRFVNTGEFSRAPEGSLVDFVAHY